MQARRVGSEVHHWQVGMFEIPFWLAHCSHGHVKSQLFPISVLAHRTVGITFRVYLLPGTVVNSKKSECQPNPMTHHGRHNELAEPRQASSNKWADTVRSLSSEVAPQTGGPEAVGTQHRVYWRQRLMAYGITYAFPLG